VVQTHPGQEQLAQEHLAKQHFMPFLPLVARLSTKRTKRGVVELVPLFSGYLFARFDQALDRWQSIRSTYGVKQLLGSTPERPTPLPAGCVEHWIREATMHMVIKDIRPPEIPVGALLRINDGPFTSHGGVCLWSGEHCVKLLMDMFGQKREIEVKRSQVERVQ
jgi:transcriptional antiterminator RfaH